MSEIRNREHRVWEHGKEEEEIDRVSKKGTERKIIKQENERKKASKIGNSRIERS
jgi:hypothetical protein